MVLHCDCTAKEEDIDNMLDTWVDTNSQPLERWKHLLSDFKVGQTHEFAKFSVALRELMLLSLNCQRLIKES